MGAEALSQARSKVGTAGTRARVGWPTVVWLIGVLAVLLAESLIVRSTVTRMIAPYVPLWADQVQYLTEAYRGYDLIREHGILVGTVEAIQQPRPQGWLLQTLASWRMLLDGPSRTAALDVNLALALLWLGTSAYVMRRLFGEGASLVTIGLLVSSLTITQVPGGLFDFRLDFGATCLWGTLVAAVAASSSLRGLTLPILAFLAGAFLIATRFISGFYLLPFGGLVVLLAGALAWRARSPLRPALAPWLGVSFGWGALFGTMLLVNYESFSAYYLLNHVTGGERDVRRAAMNLSGLRDDLLYYLNALLTDHLGRVFLWLALAAVVGSVVWGVLARRRGARESTTEPVVDDRAAPHVAGVPLAWFFGVLALGLLVPYAVLTSNFLKSGVVGGVLAPPVALGIVGLAAWITRRLSGSARALGHPAFLALGVLVAVGGVGSQWQRIRADLPGLPASGALRAYAQIMRDATPAIVQAGDRPLTWSMDGHYVEIAAPTMQIYAYEQTGRWADLRPGLGHGPLDQQFDAAALEQAARESDFLLLSQTPPGVRMSLPADQSIRDQHQVLERYAQEQMTRLGTYEIPERPSALYVRRRE